MKNFKLYDVEGNVVFQKEIVPSKFRLMDFYNEGIKTANIKPIFVDIKKTINEINEYKLENVVFRSQSVLVIEDEDMLQEMYYEHLSRLNHFVEVFSNASDALNIFSKDPSRYNTLLTDNILEGCEFNGSEVAKRVKTINSNVKVYIISGDMQSIDQNIFDFEIDGTINKPIDSFTFVSTVGNGKKLISVTKPNDSEKESNFVA